MIIITSVSLYNADSRSTCLDTRALGHDGLTLPALSCYKAMTRRVDNQIHGEVVIVGCRDRQISRVHTLLSSGIQSHSIGGR